MPEIIYMFLTNHYFRNYAHIEEHKYVHRIQYLLIRIKATFLF
jgi:hypothetical protein